MNNVDYFMLELDGPQKTIVSYLHQKLTDHHGLIGKLRYKIPFYYQKSWVCYLNPIKPDGIELVFLKGSQLSNEQGILASRNRKLVSGIMLFDLSNVQKLPLDEIIQEAMLLDELQKSERK